MDEEGDRDTTNKEENYNALTEVNRHKAKRYYSYTLRKLSQDISNLRNEASKVEADKKISSANKATVKDKDSIDKKEELKKLREEKNKFLEKQKTFQHNWVSVKQSTEARPRKRKHGENQYGTPVGDAQQYFRRGKLTCARILDFTHTVDDSEPK